MKKQPEIVDIASEGDVVFICTAGDGHFVRIRVLSVFVTTASPVLKVMLGPNFKEGNTLATRSTVEVPLPDDDPSAMILIFKAMHLRISSLPPSLDISSVKQLAAAVDKYDCAGPLAPMTYYWVQGRLLEPYGSIGVLHELLHVTYLLGQNELFGQVGIKLVLDSPSPIKGTLDSLASAYGALERQRMHTAMSLVKFVQDELVTVCDRYDDACDLTHCMFSSRYCTNFLNILRSSKLWTLDPDSFQLNTMLLAMRKVGFAGIARDCPKHSPHCSGRQWDIDVAEDADRTAETFQNRANATEKNLQPLCLGCTQAGHGLRVKCNHENDLHPFST